MTSIMDFFRRLWAAVKRLNDWLQGKRTYIIAGCIFLLGGARALNWIDQQTYEAWTGFLLGGGLASLRAAKNTNTYGGGNQ